MFLQLQKSISVINSLLFILLSAVKFHNRKLNYLPSLWKIFVSFYVMKYVYFTVGYLMFLLHSCHTQLFKIHYLINIKTATIHLSQQGLLI